jgi:alkylation response protein AidB-like acyl-CoA dehydrogenase
MLVPRRRARQRGGDVVESIRSRTSRGELPSLSHLLELAHAVGSEAERTAAEAERNRKADDAAARALIESDVLKVLQPARFGGYESGFPGFVLICQTLARYDVSLSWVYGIIGIIGGAPSSVTLEALEQWFIVTPMS